jgi:hypothetical protein
VHDLLIGSVVATILTAAVLWVGMAHRAGRITWLARLAAFSERVSGLPGWTALPSAITGGSLIVAAFGFYWDVAKHIDTGRDASPFGTAAHYPILAGLAGLTLGGYLAIVLGSDESSPTSVRLAEDWRVPVGGLLIFLCGGFALMGFPLDDIWHTLFGQDVTLWGPTHILMIAGASLATLGTWVLLIEGQRERVRRQGDAARQGAAAPTQPRRAQELLMGLRAPAIAGGFLIGLSTLQAEFDYGVPQFQLVYQPILIMLATGCGLVAARVRLGRGGALAAVAFYLVVLGGLSLAVGPLLGETTLHFPLYIVEGVLVELAAMLVPRERPLTLGVVSGALIGTIGLAAEWGWSHVWMPLPWPTSMLGQAIGLGLIAALAGGVLGGFIGQALISRGGAVQSAPRWLLGAAGLAAVACIAYPLPMNAGSPTSASVTLRDVQGGPHRTVAATIRLDPPGAARHAQWLTVTAWQGGGLVVDRLRAIAPGVYETTQPIPVYGNWKSVLRLADGRSVVGLPLYLPADRAIPAAAVPATAHFTRSFIRDKKILQREALGGSLWLTVPAYLLLLGIAALWLVGLGWGLRRLQDAERPLDHTGRPRARGALGRLRATPA